MHLDFVAGGHPGQAHAQSIFQPLAVGRDRVGHEFFNRRFEGRDLAARGFYRYNITGFDRAGRNVDLPAIDQDVDRLQVLQINADQLGREERLHCVQADVTALPAAPPAGSTFFFDPARRINGRRVHHVRDYQPALSSMHAWL